MVKKRGLNGSGKTHLSTRSARPSDIDYIRSLSEKVFHRYGPYENMLPRWFEAVITVTIMALIDKKPVGFAMFTRPDHTWGFPSACELLAIAVEPARQRLGVGDRLLIEIERMAEESGMEKVFLHTGVDNINGQKFFTRHGFALAGIKNSFYPEGQDALMMFKVLSPDKT